MSTIIYGSLSKLLGGEAVRTDTVQGGFYDFPEIGQSFIIFAKPLISGYDFRRVVTSPVVETETVGKVTTFTTKTGSIYELTID